MLSDWLGPVTLEQFRTTSLGRAPLAQPGTALGAIDLLDWNVLDRVLASGPDALVVERGQLLELPPPRSAVDLRAYFRIGVGLCLRRTERHDQGLRRVADAFERDVGAAQVQLFATPAATHGFGWHYDDEDVFIAHTAGRKDYYFRANTVSPEPASPAAFTRFPNETATLCTATLVAGDFLYIPARWWHMAICHEDSLSISVGVFPRKA